MHHLLESAQITQEQGRYTRIPNFWKFPNVFISYFSDISSLIHEVFGLYDHAKVVDTEVLSAQAKFPNCWVHGCT